MAGTLCLHRDRVRSSKGSPHHSGGQSDRTSLPLSRFLHTVLQPTPPQPGQEPSLSNRVPSLAVHTPSCPPSLFLDTRTHTVGLHIRGCNLPRSGISNTISHPGWLSPMTIAVGSLVMAKTSKPRCTRALQGIPWCVTLPGTLWLPGMATTACRALVLSRSRDALQDA